MFALINYSTQGKYREIQNLVHGQYERNTDKLFEFTEEWIKEQPLYSEHPYIFSQKHGAGNCLWKPYIILNVMDTLNEGDLIFYLDVADKIKNDYFFTYFKEIMNSRDIFLSLNVHQNSNWTKRDCFIGMSCDTEEYWNHRQLEAGTVGFRNTPFNRVLVEQWLTYAKSIEIMTDDKSVWGEDLPGFVQTRCDQSILTNLAIRYKLPTIDIFEVMKYIDYNGYL